MSTIDNQWSGAARTALPWRAVTAESVMSIFILTARILLTVAFALAGIAKLCGVRQLKDQFDEFGLPNYAIYLVGLSEIAGAIMVQFELISFFAATGLALIMAGAVYYHLKAGHAWKQPIPATVLMLLASVVAVLGLTGVN